MRLAPVLLLLLLVLLAGAGPGAARDEEKREDHERASEAVRLGQALPLSEILHLVGDRLGGEVIGVELEREDGRLVYEFKVITPGGRLLEVVVDALTGEILEVEED